MLPSLGEQWQQERRLLGVLLRLCFGVAGLLWIPLSLMNITADERAAYTLSQYQLYLFLLTLWGYDYRRQLKRTECVLGLANAAAVAPMQVRWEQIVAAGQASLFDVLRRRDMSQKWFPLVFTWTLLLCGYWWLGRQIVRLVEFATTP
ncbi:MAG: hypothetical protein KatS3mg039_0469 [Candidatus Kapaibacterium sp.]|mgnify:CR=1 FL=1|nr:MAG: hypothetical protein KatS3mg039_0469 [Candidatus Kapabacteria bacterium]